MPPSEQDRNDPADGGPRAPGHMSGAEFRRLGKQAIDFIADYMERVERLPVTPRVKPGEIAAMLPEHPPEHPEDWAAIWGDVERVVIPGLTHWQSPNFFAFFPANSSYPGILGDLLSTGLGVQGMLWATSPACTEIETRVLDWMGGMIGLPDSFLSSSANGGGVIQGTASEATLVALLAARKRGEGGGGVVYASTQAHSSIVKAAMIAGLADGPEDLRSIRLVGVDENYAMRADLLEAAIRDDLAAGRRPMFVCATVGTTSSTAIDPVETIGAITRRYGVWLHIDAAYAGAASVCPEFRVLLRGVDQADSVTFNPHKWLLTNFDCNCLWTSDRDSLIGAMSVTPEYLKNAASDGGLGGRVFDYRDWQIPLGRRFRALKLWFVIRHYGVRGLQAHIREHVRLAEVFESLLRGDSRFELAAPRTLGLLCFRLRPVPKDTPAAVDARNKRLLDSINATGKAYLTHTVLPPVSGSGPASVPRYVLRMAIGATLTQERHVRAAWEVVRAAAGAICS